MSYKFSLSGMAVQSTNIVNRFLEEERMKLPSCFPVLVEQAKELDESGEKEVCFVGTSEEIERFKDQMHGRAILLMCKTHGIEVEFKTGSKFEIEKSGIWREDFDLGVLLRYYKPQWSPGPWDLIEWLFPQYFPIPIEDLEGYVSWAENLMNTDREVGFYTCRRILRHVDSIAVKNGIEKPYPSSLNTIMTPFNIYFDKDAGRCMRVLNEGREKSQNPCIISLIDELIRHFEDVIKAAEELGQPIELEK
jgi:hypothetical protein